MGEPTSVSKSVGDWQSGPDKKKKLKGEQKMGSEKGRKEKRGKKEGEKRQRKKRYQRKEKKRKWCARVRFHTSFQKLGKILRRKKMREGKKKQIIEEPNQKTVIMHFSLRSFSSSLE